MTQLVTRVDAQLVADVDELVAAGIVASRSEAVRVGLSELVDRHRRADVGRRIADAYRRLPQTSEELTGVDEATIALLEDERW
jgi:Arc/MetJ-type ribon-helix-helix transcriptional regulator